MPRITQKITPFLWFDNQAEEAVNFYTSIFENSKIGSAARYDEEGSKAAGRPKGSVMTVAFQLAGQDFVALNGGPVFKFSEAVSFVVNCESQKEVDHFWEKLSVGGARDYSRKPDHVGQLGAPHLAKLHAPPVVRPDRVTAQRSGQVYAHGKVVDVGGVKERAAQVAVRHQGKQTSPRIVAQDAFEPGRADRLRARGVAAAKSADEDATAVSWLIDGHRRQRVKHCASGEGVIIRREPDRD